MINRKNTHIFSNLAGLPLSIFVVVAISLFSFSTLSTANDFTSEELKQLSVRIQSNEKKFVNIKIDAETWVEQKLSSNADPCESWQTTPVHVSCTGWFDGNRKDKGRIDFHNESLGWENGSAQIDRSYSVAFDGQHGKKVFYTRKLGNNETEKLYNGELTAEAPDSLTDETARIATGRQFALFFAYPGDSNVTWSDLFQLAANNHPVVMSSFEFGWEIFQNVECIKVSSKGKKWHKSYWLDPSRGFALIGYKSTGIYEDGTERIVSFTKVTQLKEVSPGLWWPTEATIESDPKKQPCERIVYQASTIVANNPNFDDSIFTLAFPKGYKVDDKITGKTYVVDDANSK